MAMENTCPHCDREFGTSVGLQAHVRQAHDGEATAAPRAGQRALCTVHLAGPNQTGEVREFGADESVADVLEDFEIDGDVYQSNMGDALDHSRSLASLGGGNIFLTVR